MSKKRQRRTTKARVNRHRRRTQKGGVAPLTAAKIAEKVVRKLIPSTDHVLGRKHDQKCFWQRPRDRVEKVLDTTQKRHANSSGQGIRW